MKSKCGQMKEGEYISGGVEDMIVTGGQDSKEEWQ
jgi:hypothetical protein